MKNKKCLFVVYKLGWINDFFRSWIFFENFLAAANLQLFLKTFMSTKAGPRLNDLYDTTCMIQLVWLCKITNSYKFDV